MMDATTVPIDEIVATTRAFNPNFQGVHRDASNHVLYATQLLVQVEMAASLNSLTMKECERSRRHTGRQRREPQQAGN